MTNLGISLEDIIVLAIEIPCYIFHASMAIFIALQVYRKNRSFESAFFILFLSIAAADIVFYVVAVSFYLGVLVFGAGAVPNENEILISEFLKQTTARSQVSLIFRS